MKILAFLFVLWLLLGHSALFAQEAGKPEVHRIEKNYRDYLEHFDTRINRHRDHSGENTSGFFHVHPERLPAWLCAPVWAFADSLYFTGISDPGMEPHRAHELAKHRAKLMLALTGGPVVANMRDSFSKDAAGDFSELFVEYTDISAIINFPADKLNISQTHLTQYGEIIVVAVVALADLAEAAEKETTFSLKAGLYSGLARSGRQMQSDERLELESILSSPNPAKAEHHTYTYSSTKNILNILSTFNDTVAADLPALDLRYLSTDGDISVFSDFEPEELQSFSLRNGLWNAMLAAVLSQLIDATQDESMHFRQVGDTYNASALRLTRQLSSTRASSVRAAFIIYNNHLYLTSK